jgi:hypothetical protein
MGPKGMLWLTAAGGLLSLAAFGQNAPRIAPVPGDPLEMATGQIQTAERPASREAALQLLARARSSYALRSAGHGYDVKVTFTTDSGGLTDYDGAWEMEDLFDAQQGLRWTAKAAAGYTVTQIYAVEMLYGEGTSNIIPLRLQEARATLFDPLPSSANADRESIRTSTATFNGAQVTCVLLSTSGNAANSASGRRWDESEECIDPQSGLLRMHSQVPGRYASYDYSNAPQLGSYTLPRKVTITEGGKIVAKISVDSLKEISSADPGLFVPTAAMKARGRAIVMAPAQKIWSVSGTGPFTSDMTAHPVCVFGLVTPSGQLVEAHSLQPSDPNSPAAVEAAKRMNFSSLAPKGARPRQHFVFVIEKFFAAQ